MEAYCSVLVTPSRKNNSCTTFLMLLDSLFYIVSLKEPLRYNLALLVALFSILM